MNYRICVSWYMLYLVNDIICVYTLVLFRCMTMWWLILGVAGFAKLIECNIKKLLNYFNSNGKVGVLLILLIDFIFLWEGKRVIFNLEK